MIRFRYSAPIVLFWLIAFTARADDVHTLRPQAPDATAPLNVLFVVDNTRNALRTGVNGETLGQTTQGALAAVVKAIDNPHVNVGMLFFAGTSDSGNAMEPGVWALPGNTLAGSASKRHAKPASLTPCARNLLVFISHGPGDNAEAEFSLTRASLVAHFSSAQRASGPGASWLELLSRDDLTLPVFTLDVERVSTPQGRAWSEVLKQFARSGDGRYFRVDTGAQPINAVVEQVLAFAPATATQFAQVGMPLSAHRKGVYSNHVYSGQFRPDEYGRPRWFGNLKHYRLGYGEDSGNETLKLLDADSRPALDARSGQINACARSEWTPVHEDDYWQFLPEAEQRGDCGQSNNSGYSNSPDGPVVEKGGQAYVTRGGKRFARERANTRRIVTTGADFCGADTGNRCELSALDAGNTTLTAARLGVEDESSRERLLGWLRGADTEDEDGDGNRVEYRPSVHGAVIHSQPLAIDYSLSETEPRLVVFYGSDDGLLRAVNGNRAAASGGIAAGGELWAFMPPEFHHTGSGNLNNHVSFPALLGARFSKRYGPDGPLATWLDGTGNRYLAVALRRGGSALYGFDVSDPAAPSLLWRVGCDRAGPGKRDCAKGWENIGQTWSQLTVTWTKTAEQPLLLTGGGYDVCEDVDQPAEVANHACQTSTLGNALYILDASSAAILASFATERAVPGGVTVVPVAGAPDRISYAYAADAGGNVYRLSGPAGKPVGDTPPENWHITRIASLGCDMVPDEPCTANRKFLHSPDVVRLPGTARYVLLLGSGDREKAAAHNSAARGVANFLYAIEDDPLDQGWLAAEHERCGQPVICQTSLKPVALNGQLSAAGAQQWKGWKQPLRDGEQVVSPALAVSDIAYFNTYRLSQPDSGSCRKTAGIATRYAVHYRSGAGEKTDLIGTGLLPAALAGRVLTEGGTIEPFCIGCEVREAPGSIAQPAPGVLTLPPKRHVYWRIEQ